MCERQSIAETEVGIHSKMAVGRRMNYFETSENQHIKITFFLRNYFNGRRRSAKIHQYYGDRTNILGMLGDIWYDNISLTFPILYCIFKCVANARGSLSCALLGLYLFGLNTRHLNG